MNYKYRIATSSDKDAIYNVYREVMKHYITRIWGWNEEWQKNDFSSHFNANGITLAYKGDKLVGYSQVDEKRDVVFMRMLAVLPEHQRKGIGSNLIEIFVNKGNKHSKCLRLEVFKINIHARKFYEQRGFIVISEKEYSYIMATNG